MRHWFIADGAIIRYEDIGKHEHGGRKGVSVFPVYEDNGGPRRYRVVERWLGEGAWIRSAERPDLISALQLGEEWIP